MSFMIHSNFSYQEQKYAEINSIAYEPMVEENLLAQPFKVFMKNKKSRLATLHHIYTKKMG